MQNKSTKLRMIFAAMGLAGLTACGTPGTPEIVPVSNACSNLTTLTYSVPSDDPAKPETVENKFDTPETIEEAQLHNAKYRALCPEANDQP